MKVGEFQKWRRIELSKAGVIITSIQLCYITFPIPFYIIV